MFLLNTNLFWTIKSELSVPISYLNCILLDIVQKSVAIFLPCDVYTFKTPGTDEDQTVWIAYLSNSDSLINIIVRT